MKSFANICVDNGITFEEIVTVVKHLLYWGLGKIIYPILPSSVYTLTTEATSSSSLLLKNPVFEQEKPNKYKSLETRESIIKMFATPICLSEVAVNAKRPLQEL